MFERLPRVQGQHGARPRVAVGRRGDGHDSALHLVVQIGAGDVVSTVFLRSGVVDHRTLGMDVTFPRVRGGEKDGGVLPGFDAVGEGMGVEEIFVVNDGGGGRRRGGGTEVEKKKEKVEEEEEAACRGPWRRCCHWITVPGVVSPG